VVERGLESLASSLTEDDAQMIYKIFFVLITLSSFSSQYKY